MDQQRCEYPGGELVVGNGCLPPEISEYPPHTTYVSVPAHPSGGSGLPVTGGDIVGLAGIGLVAAVVGTVMVRRARAVVR